MGRHSSAAAAGAGPRFAWVAVIGAVVAAALIWFAVSRGLGPGEGAADDVAATTTGDQASQFADAMEASHEEEHTATPTEEAAPEEESTETAAQSEEAAGEDGQLPEPVAACLDQVSAGESVAQAAEISAGHWKTHYGQQLLIDAGEITFEEAQEPWAETKAEGPADMERFTAAMDTYGDSEGSCGEVAADEAGDAVDSDDLQACIDRSEALATVASRGEQVNQAWQDHLEQMEAKADTPADEYYEWWIDVVEQAPDTMEPYEDAVDTLDDAPACTVSR